MKLPPSETWYIWKIHATCGDEKTPRFMTPHADPNLYEDAFDYCFETPEKAIEFLNESGHRREAEVENWVLCKEVIGSIVRLGKNDMLPLPDPEDDGESPDDSVFGHDGQVVTGKDDNDSNTA